MKIFFVGIHNKPGKKPLDGSTKTGKIVDKIIEQLSFECEKTNLYDLDYLPEHSEERQQLAVEWFYRINIQKKDVVILLGKDVQKNFINNLNGICLIKINHPSSLFGKIKTENYIKEAVKLINSFLICKS